MVAKANRVVDRTCRGDGGWSMLAAIGPLHGWRGILFDAGFEPAPATRSGRGRRDFGPSPRGSKVTFYRGRNAGGFEH